MPIEPQFDHRRSALDYLLSGDVLWGVQYRPENLRLMRRLWVVLNEHEAERLIEHVLGGPPAPGRGGDAERRDYEIWLRLALLEREGARQLPPRAAQRLAEMRAAHPQWALSEDERDQFASWVTLRGGHRTDASADQLLAMPRPELCDRLLGQGEYREGLMMEWHRAVIRRPSRGVVALCALARDGHWPKEVWERALLGFLDAKRTKPPVDRRLVPVLAGAPMEFLREAAWAISSWLPDATRALAPSAETPFWALWERFAPVAFELAEPEGGEEHDPLTRAINEPPGRLTEALVACFFKRKPTVGGGLPADLAPRLTAIAEREGVGYRLGRVILCQHLSQLYAVDPGWTTEHLLPRFKWADPAEAVGAWQGFLSGGLVDPNVFAALKPDFWEALNHADAIPDSDLLWQVFMITCLELPGSVTPAEARRALGRADVEGRRRAASHIARMMPDDADTGAALWADRIAPWLASAWPRDIQLRDAQVSESLALAAVAAGSVFPAALRLLDSRRLLVAAPDRSHLVASLAKTDLPERFPIEVLHLLDQTIARDVGWPPRDLRPVLERIRNVRPAAAEEFRYQELDAYLQRWGQ